MLAPCIPALLHASADIKHSMCNMHNPFLLQKLLHAFMPAVHVAARRLHHASMRMQQWDYSLSGLVGFELHGKTVGVVGTGAIGSALCAILKVRALLSSS